MDQAARAYVASYLAGRDVLLMAADWARCRELSARIRDDLIHLGLVDRGRTIRIADGAQASAGDLIICRGNDHGLEAGEPGRALANGDVLRIEAITRRGIMVRRLLDPDPATGQRRFTDRAFCYDGYQSADLAYAVTGHSAQGATVHTGIALVTGTEDRQWLYPAMTRGTDTNLAFVFTTPARPADPRPGTRPAPELDRYDRLHSERQELAPARQRKGEGSADQREPIAVLADVLSRDGAELSATRDPAPNLANADHLAVLHAIWTAETRAARHDRYRDLVMAALPPGYRQPLSHQARWLFRTLHAAELAGLDPAEVIRTAIAARDLAGSRDIAAVLDARIRPRVYPLSPSRRLVDQPRPPPARPRPAGLPGRDRGPDGRPHPPPRPAHRPDRTRVGHQALGPVPADPAARQHLGTQGRLDRRLPRDVRLRPSRRPDRPRTRPRGARPAGRLARGLPRPRPGRRPRRPGHARRPAVADPRHLRRRDRLGTPARRQRTATLPARRRRRRPGRHPRRRRSRRRPQGRQPRPRRATREPGRLLPGPGRPLPAAGTTFAQTMADRQEWDHATAGSRRLAIAADAELRRRHPDQKIEPLRSAEPCLTDTTTSRISRHPARKSAIWPPGSATWRPGGRFPRHDPRPAGIQPPNDDPGWGDLDAVYTLWRTLGQDAILQPPKPSIEPSTRLPPARLRIRHRTRGRQLTSRP